MAIVISKELKILHYLRKWDLTLIMPKNAVQKPDQENPAKPQQWKMADSLHGGKSTGAKTREGIENIKKANLKSGFYTKEAIQDRKLLIDIWREDRRFLKEII